MDNDAETPVTDWVMDHPQTFSVLQELEIEDSSAGKVAEVCLSGAESQRGSGTPAISQRDREQRQNYFLV